MKIMTAKSVGFCFGVNRAIDMAFEAAKNKKAGVKLFTLGPIIHNPRVIADLRDAGVDVVDSVDQASGGTLIIRSHGVPLTQLEEAKERGIKIIDATCPFVRRAQDYARRLSDNGYRVVVVGDKEHPEVKGIVSYCKEAPIVIANAKEAASIGPEDKIGVVAQTTQSVENFEKVVEELRSKAREVQVYKSICEATELRQKEAGQLARDVDCIFVVGGYNSANTNRLANICRRINPSCHHIEAAEEVSPDWLKGVKKVGITGGASTPLDIINQVEKKIIDIVHEIDVENGHRGYLLHGNQ